MKTPWAWFRDLFARRGQDPALQRRYVLPYPVAGVNLSADEALSLSVVWACIGVISKSVASCKWNIYEPRGPGRRELRFDDPATWLLNTRPNPEMTAIGFWEAMMLNAIPFGNAYAEIVRDGGGRVVELWPLPEDRVTPRRRPDNWELVYEYRQPNGTMLALNQRQVFHLRGPGLYGLLGENVVARAAKSLAVAAAQERYSASFFGQGANPSGVLSMPGTLTDSAYERMKNDWAQKKQGPENAHKPMILEAGLTWTPISVDPQKSQLVEGRQFSVEEICRWFGVPPHKVQHLLRSTNNNIEHQSIEFVRDACVPWSRRLEQEADYKLFPQGRAPYRNTSIDLAPLMAGDALSRAQAHAVWRQNGVMSANEIREREGLNDAGDDGDVLLVQSNLTTVERLVNPPSPPAAVAPALPPGAPDNTPGDETLDPSTEARAVALQSLAIIMGGAVERYARRLANRRADLSKRMSGEALEFHLNEERPAAWEKLLAELAPAEPIAARALGRSVEAAEVRRAVELAGQGWTPQEAAVKALPASCPRPA